MQDVGLVIGTSGKREAGPKTSFRHLLMPWDVAVKACEHGGRVALVFGEEGVGLSTPELDLCDLLATIPTWEGYPICNLSHAVAVMLYEFSRSSVTAVEGDALSGETRRVLKQAISEMSSSLSYTSTKARMVSQTLERTILRSIPGENEAKQLIGAYVEAATALQKVAGDDDWKRSRRRRLE